MIDLDAIFRALAHPFRRQVLQWLSDPAEYFSETEHAPFRGVSAMMVHARSGLSQSTVSSHLSQLERAGLLNAQRVGQWVFLSRNEDAIREFAERLCVDFARTTARP
ncbi:ArsR/SmtB family transcription factor [Paraburkholderia fungorum]|uniref:ArsR/SmtB family transcription factor n=1 Tax=Paraburkholderia fungorum TaxID=134537 RepID=UPI0038B9E182